jgi:hypothetical protein
MRRARESEAGVGGPQLHAHQQVRARNIMCTLSSMQGRASKRNSCNRMWSSAQHAGRLSSMQGTHGRLDGG